MSERSPARVARLYASALCLLLAAPAPIAARALTESDAVRIGRDADVAGLRALVAERNRELLYRAAQSWNAGASRHLSPELEALIVENYGDSLVQRPLLALIATGLEGYERHPKYRSRRLFDLLHADLRAGKDSLHYALHIIATDLPVESELAASLARLDAAAANEIVMFLGGRKYAPAVPALQALQARIPHERNTNQMLERVNWAYLQIGTPEAIQAFLARLRRIGETRGERAASELWAALHHLSQQPASAPPDYAELRAALPAQLGATSWEALIRLIERRKEARGVPELLRAIAESPRAEQAVDALLAIGGPADWRAARAPTAALQKKLDDALADPAGFVARRGQRERMTAYQGSEDELAREKIRIAPLRQTDPGRYMAQMRALLDRREALLRELGDVPRAVGARDRLVREAMDFAGVLRFELRRPGEAIGAYERAQRALPAGAFDIASVHVADVLRFDKRDARAALVHYRRAMASGAPTGTEETLLRGMRTWLEHEIAYLERGRRFAGSVGPHDMQAAMLWLHLAAMQTSVQARADDARALERLPASQFQIARALSAVFDLPPKEMLAFFAKHDPAGYLTAGLLSSALATQPSPYVKAAAEEFFRSHGAAASPAAARTSDPRYASPERTWNTFIAAAKRGDAGEMLACFTPGMQGKLQGLFARMSPDERRAMGESFVGFAMDASSGGEREAAIVRQLKGERRAGFVTFMNVGGAWKIDSM